MMSRSVAAEASRQRSSGCELRRPDRLCRARLPISSDSLARSATEIRDMRRLSPAPILSFYPQDSEATKAGPVRRRGGGNAVTSAAAARRRSRRARPSAARQSGKWKGNVRSSPAPLRSSGWPNASRGRDRDPLDPVIAREQAGDLLLAFLGLERADAIDERAAGPGQLDRAIDQLALHLDERRDVGLAFSATARRDGGGSCRSRSRAHRAAQHRTARLEIRAHRLRRLRR